MAAWGGRAGAAYALRGVRGAEYALRGVRGAAYALRGLTNALDNGSVRRTVQGCASLAGI